MHKPTSFNPKNNPDDLAEPKLLSYIPLSKELWSHTEKFTAEENMKDHFLRHDQRLKEFPEGFKDTVEYGDFAKNFIRNPPYGSQMHIRQNQGQLGEKIVYFEDKNTVSKFKDTIGFATVDDVLKSVFRTERSKIFDNNVNAA